MEKRQGLNWKVLRWKFCSLFCLLCLTTFRLFRRFSSHGEILTTKSPVLRVFKKHQILAIFFGPLEAFLIFSSVSIILTSLRGSFDITKLWFGIRIEHLRCDKVNCSKRLILYKKLTVYSNWLLFGKSKYWSLNSYCLAIFWLLFDVFYFLIS